MKSKTLSCECCSREVNIRSKNKNPNSPFFNKKLCSGCNYIHTEHETKSYKIPKQTVKNKIAKSEKKKLLDPFFEYHIEKIKKGEKCIHCNIQLKGIRDEVAHILPKRKYKSVMNNLDNAVYMCSRLGINCHKEWDDHENNAEYLLSMPGVSKVVDKFEKFKKFVTETGSELTTLENISNILK